jgi:hypothetical protein
MPDPPVGVPAYGWEQLAALAGLATGPMMRRERKQPAPGQTPAGTYWTGHAWHSLWRMADLVDMPPLSPGRQRRWDLNRTCARCEAVSADPWPRGRDSRRYCHSCVIPAAEESWAAERAAERPGLTAWARELLADERTVLVSGRSVLGAVRVLAETPGGVVLADALIRTTASGATSGNVDFYAPPSPAENGARVLDTGSGVEVLAGLVGKRLVCWRPWTDLGEATLNLRQDQPHGPGLGPGVAGRLRTAPGDVVGPRWDRWVGHPSGSVRYADRCTVHLGPSDPAEVVPHMRRMLGHMATETLT